MNPHADSVQQPSDEQALLGWTRYEKARKLNPAQWAELHQRNLRGENFDDMIDALPATTQPVQQGAPTPAEAAKTEADADGDAFRKAAELGLTLRFYGGCAQSGMPGSPCAYEVVNEIDRASSMREAVKRAAAVIAKGGESQRLGGNNEAA